MVRIFEFTSRITLVVGELSDRLFLMKDINYLIVFDDLFVHRNSDLYPSPNPLLTPQP